MKLVYTDSGNEVKVGDRVKLHNDDGDYEVVFFRPPHKPESSGKVSVAPWMGGAHNREYYVGVIGAKWIDREDQV